MKFGDVLRELIESNNLTQKQLSYELNIAPSTLGNYVRNIREPDHSTLLVFAKYFNVSTDYMLGHNTDEKISHEEEKLLNTFKKLDSKNKEILIRQAQVLYDVQKKEF